MRNSTSTKTPIHIRVKLVRNDRVAFPGMGVYTVPQTAFLSTTDPEYNRLLADGYTVRETWNVYECFQCGYYYSDKQGPGDAVTHRDRHGHDPK